MSDVTPAAAPILRAARERIADPRRWAKGAFVTINGQIRGLSAVDRPRACLCVAAAVIAASPIGAVSTGAGLCLSLAARARGYETASKLNDAPETTHADVLSLLDEAAALAESLAGGAS